MINKENNQDPNNLILIDNIIESINPINQLETIQLTENQNNMIGINNYFVNGNIFLGTETLHNQNFEDSYKMVEMHVNTLLEDSDDFFDNQEIRRTKSYSDLSQRDSISESVWEIEISDLIDYNPQPLLEMNIKDIYKGKIERAREHTSQRENTSDAFKGCNCYCCKNYLTIHDKNVWDYLNKYNIKNKEIIPRSSRSIKVLFMLRPDIFVHRNLKDFRYLKNWDITSIVTNQSYEYKYEIWTWNEGYPETVVKCSLCEKEFCSNHLDYNPFIFKNCKCCSKKWSICSWCLFDSFDDCIIGSKMAGGLSLLDEDIFCQILHTK